MSGARKRFGELPDVLASVADQVGLGAAAAFARAFGGRRVYVPRPERLGPKHRWVEALGRQGLTLQEARQLAEAVGPGMVDAPFGPFVGRREAAARVRSEVVTRLRDRQPKAQIAEACVLTERRVYQIQVEERCEAALDPLPLFPEIKRRT